MSEIREVLRGWLEGVGLRTVAERAGVDRKTARRYVQAAQAAGLDRGAGFAAVDDVLIAAVVDAVRPARPNGHGTGWEALLAREEQIRAWLTGKGCENGKPLTVVKVHELLTRQGCVVPYRTVHRFAAERCGYRAKGTTVRVNDGEPGAELQIDFGHMGYLTDPETGRRRKVHALILTAAYSRHMFVWLTFSQTLAAVIAGCEAAWVFFGGVFKVLIPDNLSPVVTTADAVNPRFTQGWVDYAQHAGFATDPARVRSPQDKPRVERAVQYVRGNFWAGETFTDLADAQDHAEVWCRQRAGMRLHGTIQARPLEVFTEEEAGALLPVPAGYDVPLFATVKVHRDFHLEVGKALYSVPGAYLGERVDVRADSELVKVYHHRKLVTTHPRQLPGGRSTHPEDLPKEKTIYAMRDLARLIATAASHGSDIGIYAERILDAPLPWTKMRTVYRLLGLVSRYGPGPVNAACGTALDLDVVSVSKVASMLDKATERATPLLPTGTTTTARFARDPAEYATTARRGTAPATTGTTADRRGTGTAGRGTTTLTLIRGGLPAGTITVEELPEEDTP